MKAISFRQQLPIENPESLIDVVIDKPKPETSRSPRSGPCDFPQSCGHQDPKGKWPR